jgi:hypothetical protein
MIFLCLSWVGPRVLTRDWYLKSDREGDTAMSIQKEVESSINSTFADLDEYFNLDLDKERIEEARENLLKMVDWEFNHGEKRRDED